ncbi:cytochrome O ubiquinol oxidase [Stenotrophomonas pictorum JCM 9942]|uniref:Ubiquinol oxidase subunit 2 n=1 Tax=Stenotrophomonas pictorum JCM 9942 TaxID=1236960 RepID=A0A0R0ABM8_9GAMM|nr:ubiquinol oxidase subunit II [Stenotrophomonas pictorum]KRG39938.1 cytochrome O ubiquinol oxidase [Stenotrophomonas pictorum JCM 9942]
MIPLKTLGRMLRPGLIVAMAVLMTGCDWSLFDPKGHIAREELTLLITCTVLMLLVVIPVIIMTLVFAWKYRASNTSARYEPKWSHSTAIEVVVWSIPCMIVLVLAVLTWRSSHALDPYKPLESDKKAITIEAVSLDWKWLFIYPEENVAVVNELTFPVGAPLNFKLTSDTVMNAFFIPHLGSMVYSMAGMETKLHLIADEAGSFDGMSSHYSGAGFNKMHFKAHAVTDEQYQQWLAKVRAEGSVLDQASLTELGAQKNHDWFPVTYYASTQAGLFDAMIARHMGDNHHYGMKHDRSDAAANGVSHEGHDAGDTAPQAEHHSGEHAAAGHAGHSGSGE